MNGFNKISVLIMIFILLTSCTKKRIKEYYEGGELKQEYFLKNNKKDGECVAYFLNGNIKSKAFYKNGFVNGLEMEYFEDGQIKSIGKCSNGLRYGWFYYYGKKNHIDSIIEYVPINSSNPLDAHLGIDSVPVNVSMINRRVYFDAGSSVNKSKSVFFRISNYKDTVFLGRKVNIAIDFKYQTNNQKNNFTVYANEVSSDSTYVIYPKTKVAYISFITYKRGVNIVKGYIEEETNNGSPYYWFFTHRFYVK